MSTKTLDQSLLEEAGISVADFRPDTETAATADRRDGRLYRYSPEIKLALRVAIAVERPLLILGPSGSGKSSMVFNVARLLRRRYYEFVVSSRAEAKDLYYSFDAVRRLGEAQLGANAEARWRSFYPFIDPGPLWWVFSPETARHRGAPQAAEVARAIDPGRWPDNYAEPSERPLSDDVNTASAVLLIDEIDKADPDFANNLLVPLGSRQFVVQETGDLVRLGVNAANTAPLIVITSNRERELPHAFVRRCIVLEIQPPTVDDLVSLAEAHFRQDGPDVRQTWRRIAEMIAEIRGREPVSAPEYLDAVRAIEKLGGDESQWKEILMRTNWTSDQDGQL